MTPKEQALEDALVRTLEKNRKLESDNESLKRKLVMYSGRNIDVVAEAAHKLSVENKKLETEKEKLRETNKKMEHFRKINPGSMWYEAYLQSANATLERQLFDAQYVIEQYQKHYAQFGHFYTEYMEVRNGKLNTDVPVGENDALRDVQLQV